MSKFGLNLATVNGLNFKLLSTFIKYLRTKTIIPTYKMSSVSVTSAKNEKESMELVQELESVRALNSSLRAYLEHLRTFKKNMNAVNENTKILKKVNSQWIETLNNMK